MQEISSNTFIPPHPLKTAVLFLVFNRPDTTKQVFKAIRQAKPPRLYVAADGPRADKSGEAEKVEQVRRIATQVDWECEVKTLFRDKNLGCGKGVSRAITWFFENEEEGIILEDDCLPSQSFFWFCEELLERYRGDERVMHIGGCNPIDKQLVSNIYYFSKYNRIWGWASWRRAWKYYDVKISLWPLIKRKKLHYSIFNNRKESRLWESLWDIVYSNKLDTWDYQWFFCRVIQGKAIIPCVNLVSNIGFNKDGTHTHNQNEALSKLITGEAAFPLIHPAFIIEDAKRDKLWSDVLLNSHMNLFSRIKKYFKVVLRIVKWK